MTATTLRRPAAITKALLLAAATVGFMVGIPWALVHFVGNPLPTVVPSLEDIRFAITHGQIDQWTIVKGVALIAWLAWAQLAASFAVEIAAAMRGGTAAAVRGLGATQWLAARIVAKLGLVFSLTFQSTIGIATAGATPLPLPDMAMATAQPQAMEADPGTVYLQLEQAPATENEGSIVEIGRRDTLWGLAEQHLGDGQRWEEIRDANVGRTMPDGTQLPEGFTTLTAGWTILIPGLTESEPTTAPESGAEPSVDADDEITETATLETGRDAATGEWIIGSWNVERGDHFWKISEQILEEAWGRPASNGEITGYWLDVVEANRQHLISPGGDANLIYPDQRFEVLLPPIPTDITSSSDAAVTTTPYPLDGLDQFTPNTPTLDDTTVAAAEQSATPIPAPIEEPAPDSQTPEPDPTPPTRQAVPTPAVETPAVAADTSPTAAGESGRSINVAAIGLGLFGTAVGAGALMLVLRVRRRHQAARRRPNTTIEDTPIMPSEFEHRIRPIGDTDAVRWLSATNQFLTHRLAQHPENPLPAVVAMRAGKFGVEILLDEPCLPVEGFINGGADGKAWRLHPDLDTRMIEAEAAHAQPYCPALLPVGSTDAGDLLLDFEQIGALSLTGHIDTAIGWLGSIAIGVTSVPWSQRCEVIAIGLGDEIAMIDQVTVPDDPTEWARNAVTVHNATAHRLTASPYEQRVNPGEIHHPQLVLIGPDHPGIAQHLADTADLAYSPLAVIAVAPLPNETRIDIQPDNATIEPLGIDFTPATTELDAITLAVRALTAASNTVTTPEPDYFQDDHHEPEHPDSQPNPDRTSIDLRDPAVADESEDTDSANADQEVVYEPEPNLEHSAPQEINGDKPHVGSNGYRVTESVEGNGDPASANGVSDEPPTTNGRVEREAPRIRPHEASDEVKASIAAICAPQPVEVRVLGPTPELDGLSEEPRAKIAAVIVYLAYCRSLPSERIRSVFWPTSVSRGTSDNAIAEARRLLGTDTDGNSRLPLATNTGRFEASPEIGCDWHRFEQLAKLATNTTTPEDEVALLRATLELVHGRPMGEAPVKLYRWFTDDHEIYVRVETAIVDAAYRLGELAIETGDAELARWAAKQGLEAVPGQEALHRIQMKAAAFVGDDHGIETAYRAAMRAAEELSAWEDVQPETEELYATLTRRDLAGRDLPAGR